MSKPLSLYFHIPFCKSRCFYCDFYSNTDNSDVLKNIYTNALIKSLNIPINSDDYIVKTIYFGGGTPTLLGAGRIEEILNSVRSIFNVASDCEITVETNPNSICSDEFRALKNAGVNRISFGVQSLCDELLVTIGRTHNAKTAIDSIINASNAGFENISVDMMFGLPDQEPEQLYDDLQMLLQFNQIKHISLYNLRLEEGTKLFDKRDLYYFLDDDAEADMYFNACKILGENGFSHYEISNFARSGYESQHNLNYWRCGDFLGFGAAAHSRFNNRLFKCEPNIYKFISLVNYNGDLFEISSYKQAEEMSDEERDAVCIMMSLRTAEGLDISRLNNPDTFLEKTKRFASSGLLLQNENRFRLTEEAFFISNTIISALI